MNTATNSSAKRVLIVDDEPGVLLIVQRILRLAGYATGVAEDGATGLSRFVEEPWDLVITDRTMPGLNGEELAERIKERVPMTPVILITGFAHLVQRVELFEAVFAKPFRSDELLTAVRQALVSGDR